MGIMVLIIILFSSSCVYDKDLAYINDQIIALNNRVESLQESMDQRVEPQLSRINSNQAETMAEVDRLKTEIIELEGRVEDNEHIIKESVEKDLGPLDSGLSGAGDLPDLNARVERLEALMRGQNVYPASKSTPVREKEKRDTETAGTRDEPSTVAKVQRSPEDEGYNRSLTLFREGKYGEAMDGFVRFLDVYPKSELADNAQFWIGESYMALKQYEKAILAYQDVIEKYPKGNKVPNAMQRQAMAWLEIDDKTSARAVFKKLIRQFPNSDEAKIAQKKLDELE